MAGTKKAKGKSARTKEPLAEIGVIGGSGLYGMEGLEGVREHAVITTFGAPSDAVIEGRLGETRMLFLPRHGRGHRFAPHEINYRANVLALKMLGAEQIVSVSAVGSMKESIHPGDVVCPDQFLVHLRHRRSTHEERSSSLPVRCGGACDRVVGVRAGDRHDHRTRH